MEITDAFLNDAKMAWEQQVVLVAWRADSHTSFFFSVIAVYITRTSFA